DAAIINYVKKEYSLMLGERTAEEIKIAIGSAFPAPEDSHAEIRGRDLVTGLPKTIVVSAEEIRKAIEEPVNAVVDAVKTTLDKCPPELSGDVMDRGIVLTGGGALLRGLDERLKHETGMPIIVADDPLQSVALGSGRCVEDFESLQQVLAAGPRSRRRMARKPSRRQRTALIALLLLAAVFITLDARGTAFGGLRSGAETVFGPVQRGLATIFGPVGRFLGGIPHLGSNRSDI